MGKCDHPKEARQFSLWYISGNRGEGDIFAIPVIEIEAGAVILSEDITRLRNSELDGARRWVVVADSGEEAVSKLARFCLNDPELSLPALGREMGIPYPTLVSAAQQGRLPARKVGERMWLSTRRAVEAAGIKSRKESEMVEYKVFLDGGMVKVCHQSADGRQIVEWEAHDGPLATSYARGRYSWAPTIEGKDLEAKASSNDGDWSEEEATEIACKIEQAPKFDVFVRF